MVSGRRSPTEKKGHIDPNQAIFNRETDHVVAPTCHVAARTKLVAARTSFVVAPTKPVAARTKLVGGTTCHVAGRTAERSEPKAKPKMGRHSDQLIPQIAPRQTDLSATKAAARDRRRARSTLAATSSFDLENSTLTRLAPSLLSSSSLPDPHMHWVAFGQLPRAPTRSGALQNYE